MRPNGSETPCQICRGGNGPSGMILTMPSADDYPDGFGCNPLGDAVTGFNQSDCEEKPSLKFATPGSGRNDAIDSLPSAGSRSTLTNRNDRVSGEGVG
jgi:hypothetical protein